MISAVFRKVGRPRAFTDEELGEVLAFAATHLGSLPASRRGQQDAAYSLRAAVTLASAIEDPERNRSERELLLWFGEPGDPRTWRRTLLAELGRFGDARSLVAVAVEVARVRPRARDGAALIRLVRKELEA